MCWWYFIVTVQLNVLFFAPALSWIFKILDQQEAVQESLIVNLYRITSLADDVKPA